MRRIRAHHLTCQARQPAACARQAGITAPAQIADLIDQLRADEVVLTYDPHNRTLRADGHDTLSVTVGKNR
jgi:hypothetical protein